MFQATEKSFFESPNSFCLKKLTVKTVILDSLQTNKNMYILKSFSCILHLDISFINDSNHLSFVLCADLSTDFLIMTIACKCCSITMVYSHHNGRGRFSVL